jgi:hypothetical protein
LNSGLGGATARIFDYQTLCSTGSAALVRG